MSVKKYDVSVAIRTVKDADGERKIWKQVGAVFIGDAGGQYMLLDRTFNPAGVINPENKDSVLLSFFEPTQQQGRNANTVRTDERQ